MNSIEKHTRQENFLRRILARSRARTGAGPNSIWHLFQALVVFSLLAGKIVSASPLVRVLLPGESYVLSACDFYSSFKAIDDINKTMAQDKIITNNLSNNVEIDRPYAVSAPLITGVPHGDNTTWCAAVTITKQ